MIKIIAPHPNTTLQPTRNALFVLRPWTLSSSTAGWKAYRDLIVHYRANPRNTEYMLERANEFISNHMHNTTIDLCVHKTIENEIKPGNYPWINNIIHENEIAKIKSNQYDTIVFLYADAIGLGWNDLENKIQALSPNQVVVINGRRRVFIWDKESRKKLNFRRFMSQAWWWEWLFAPWLFITSSLFFLIDIFHPKKVQ